MSRGRRDKDNVVIGPGASLALQVSRGVHKVNGAGDDLYLVEVTPGFSSFVGHFAISEIEWKCLANYGCR